MTAVREALNFSALLRQPAHILRAEKLAYIDEVIELLEMEEYADVVIDVPGEGLNVEQRKRLTIGLELAAEPPLLLFVDEPTSGLDSQTSWAILDLLEKLTKSGQAILCTIHQPSAMLFQLFDRPLFLAKGGRTVYFGDIGKNSKTMTSYLSAMAVSLALPRRSLPSGCWKCGTEGVCNVVMHCVPGPVWLARGWVPACLRQQWAGWTRPQEVIGAAPGSTTDVDWHSAWRESPEYAAVKDELQRLKRDAKESNSINDDLGNYREFAASF